MAVGVVIEIPGGTREQYDAVMDELALGGRMAPGGLFHVAGPMEGGWRVVDVWETAEDFQHFATERLGAALATVGVPPFEPVTFPVHDIMTERHAASPAPVKVVQRAFACFAAGDVPGLFALIAEDVEWREPEAGGRLPWCGTFRGHAGVRDWLAALAAVESFTVQPLRFVANGEDVVVLAHETGWLKATGKAYACDVAVAFRVRDGRIASMQAYSDTAAIVEAAG